MALLEIRELTVDFAGPRPVRAVDGVSLDVGREECLAIVGESGSGKSQLLLACVGLLAANGNAGGAVRFDDGAAVSARGWAQAGELIRRAGVWRAIPALRRVGMRPATRRFSRPKPRRGSRR